MKKNTKLQTGLIAILALIIGFAIGTLVDIPSTDTDDLAGAIGKVDRYRNVQVTEDDILLRNELVEDSAKRELYQQYLTYYYYKTLKTANDLERVLENTRQVEEFSREYPGYFNTLADYREYLKTAQTDILLANTMVTSLDENEEVPIITYLNQANNAIARMRSNDDIMLDYLKAMEAFIQNHPGQEYPSLADAHDILSLNVIQSAAVANDKPVLKYLDQTKLMNKKEELKDLVNQDQFNDFIAGQIKLDTETVGSVISDMENLGLLVLLNDMENLGNAVMNDVEKLNIVLDMENLGVVITLDQENLGVFDMEKLNMAADMEKLGTIRDIEHLQEFMDTEKLHGDIRPM